MNNTLREHILSELLKGHSIKRQSLLLPILSDQGSEAPSMQLFTRAQVSSCLEACCMELFGQSTVPKLSIEQMFAILDTYDRNTVDRYVDLKLFDVVSGKHAYIPKAVVSRWCNKMDGKTRLRRENLISLGDL